MKRVARKLELRGDTLRVLRSAELTYAAGGLQCPYTISQLMCPDTWCATCGDSCTADLRTT